MKCWHEKLNTLLDECAGAELQLESELAAITLIRFVQNKLILGNDSHRGHCYD